MQAGWLKTENRLLYCVSPLAVGTVNEAWVVRDMSVDTPVYFTLIELKDRSTTRLFLRILSENDCVNLIRVDSFVVGENLCYLFPYQQERKLAEFLSGQTNVPAAREEISINFVLSCLENPLPYPLMHLQLDQGLVNLNQDNSIYFSYGFDLGKLDRTMGESDCVTLCASELIHILNTEGRRALKSYSLLSGKVKRKAYSHFSDLYHDIRITVIPEKTKLSISLVKRWFYERKDGFFRLIFVVSIILAIIALLMLISYVAFGDFSLIKLFGQGLNTIGTERLDVK
jgi:hypothetical protein